MRWNATTRTWCWRGKVERRLLVAGTSIGLGLVAACSSNSAESSACMATDQDGTAGEAAVVKLFVSDTAFAEGNPDSGQPNVTFQNLAPVTFSLTNVGTKPHDFVVRCLSTPNLLGCPTQSCFPAEAGIPALQPGQTAKRSFVAPFPEGAYPFVSDLPGDSQTSPDGGITGLVGAFNLM